MNGPELTLRALVVGGLVGGLLALVNTYMALKTGWTDPGNVTASILGFALCAIWARAAGGASGPLETNIVQTVATSAGAASSVMGLIGPIPSLASLGRRVPALPLLIYGVLLAALGLALAVRLRPRLLEGPRALPFPTGVATSEVIRALHGSRREGARRARVLGLSALATGALTWFRDGKPALLPQLWRLPFPRAGVDAAPILFGVAVSPMMLGAGLLAGPQLGVSVLLGAVAGWVVIVPRLLGSGVVQVAEYPALSQWLIWPAVALFISSSVTTLAFDARSFLPSARERGERPAPSREARRALLVAAAASAGAALIAWRHFGVSAAAACAGFALLPLLVGVSSRSAGATDVAPTGDMGTITQTALATIARGDPISTLAPGGAVMGAATQTATTLWALRAGALLGANWRKQIWAQAVGALIGVALSLPVYELLDRAYSIGSVAFPCPAAMSWRATAEGLAHGAAAIPKGALAAAAVAAAIGIFLTVLGRVFANAKAKWIAGAIPSAVGIGVGVLVPFGYSILIFGGGVIAGLVARKSRVAAEETLPCVASGMIAGEALLGVLVAILILLGVLARAA